MAHLYFIYAAMNSGKSLDLIKTAHNYEVQGKKVLVFTSCKDTRSNKEGVGTMGKVMTRVGLEREAYLIEKVDCYELAKKAKPDCVLVDEAQFLDTEQVLKLVQIADKLDIPVICYGLKNDFRNELFEGSKALLVYADKIQELKTVCWFCNSKATMNMRVENGRPVFKGEQIKVGWSIKDGFEEKLLEQGSCGYIPVCRKCYMKFKGFYGGDDE